MKKKKFKTINIAATVIFVAALILNIQSGFHGGYGLFGFAAIGQGTGSGGSGSGSGSGSGAIWYGIAHVCRCVDSTGQEYDYGSWLECRPNGTTNCKATDCDTKKRPSACQRPG